MRTAEVNPTSFLNPVCYIPGMQSEPNARSGREFLAVALVAMGVGLATAFSPTQFFPCDFIAFWSSSALFVDGHNPYDPALLLPLQYDAGFQRGYAITIFNPPWVLPLLAPLGALKVGTAFAVWQGLQFALVLIAAGWLWQAFGGRPERQWSASALSITFAPTFLLLTSGQITGLTLFGLAGYLRFRDRRSLLAGCLGALTALKPHLFGLFAVALVIDAVRSPGGRRVVLGGAGVLLVLSIAALAVRPGVFGEYAGALTAPSSSISKAMTDYPAPVIGVMLRDGLPGRPGWVAFLPLITAATGLLMFARRLPSEERWVDVVPFLVAGSLLVAPYGAWWYDMILLFPLVLLAAARLSEVSVGMLRVGLAAFVLLDLAVLFLYSGRDHLGPLFALLPPVVAVGGFVLILATRPVAPRAA